MPIETFIGITTNKSIYGDRFGIINIGVKGIRDIKLSEKFITSLQLSLIVNTQKEKIHLVGAISL